MFRQISDFLQAHDGAVQRTEKIFAALTDGNLRRDLGPNCRTLGQVAWHIVTTVPEMMGRTGLGVSGVDPASLPPATAAEVQSAYRAVARSLREAVATQWTDATLTQVDTMYGETWPRGVTLGVLMGHEAHHVGQMTILLRLAGEKVPGIMGPSKEEWAQYGMDAPAY